MQNKSCTKYSPPISSTHRTFRICFVLINNSHRDAYQKVTALCLNPNNSDLQWMQLVENTNWPSIIRLVLSASWQTAFHVHYNRLPVLLHCSVSDIFLSTFISAKIFPNKFHALSLLPAWMGPHQPSCSAGAGEWLFYLTSFITAKTFLIKLHTHFFLGHVRRRLA